MTKFKFIVENGRATVDTDGTMFDIAHEVGHLANTIFSALMNHDPKQATDFKFMVMALCGNEGSPIWKRRKPNVDDIEIFEESYDGEEMLQ